MAGWTEILWGNGWTIHVEQDRETDRQEPDEGTHSVAETLCLICVLITFCKTNSQAFSVRVM